MSWRVEPEGTILMGGQESTTTSEIVKHDGTTERTFDMKYWTWYVLHKRHQYVHYNIIVYCQVCLLYP